MTQSQNGEFADTRPSGGASEVVVDAKYRGGRGSCSISLDSSSVLAYSQYTEFRKPRDYH